MNVDPKKRMLFDPKESIDLKGKTAPFIQYSYTRTQALKRKAEGRSVSFDFQNKPEEALLESERSLLKLICNFPDVLADAGEKLNPSLIARYAYEVAKEYNRFYRDAPILSSKNPHTSAFRFALSDFAGKTIAEAMSLLGIEMPERM